MTTTPPPYGEIRKLVRTEDNGGSWKAYNADGEFLMRLTTDALPDLARVTEADIKVEIEGQWEPKCVFVREGTVLVFRGLEVWDHDGMLEVEFPWRHNIDVQSGQIKAASGLSLRVEVGASGAIDFNGMVLDWGALNDLLVARDKVRDLEAKVAILEAKVTNLGG